MYFETRTIASGFGVKRLKFKVMFGSSKLEGARFGRVGAIYCDTDALWDKDECFNF